MKIMNEIPLPIPFSVICSPIHIAKIAPAVNVSIAVRRKGHPGLKTIFITPAAPVNFCDSKKIAIATA
jgi:hypothetical protein